MQRILILVLTASTAVGAWFAVHYHGQIGERDARIATLTAERDAARAAESTAIANVDPLKEDIERLKRERDRLQALAKNSQTQPQPPTEPQPPAADAPDPGRTMQVQMAAMLKTEAGRNMLQTQSAARVKSQYSELAKRLKLTPQDTGVLLSLLADRQTALTKARINSSGNSAELATQTASIQGEFEEKLRATLGDAGYDQYAQYEQTAEERAIVNRFDEQFTAAGTPLDPNQKESLIQLINEERKKSPGNPFDLSKNDPTTVLNALKDDATFNTWVQQQQEFQNRLIQAASKTLNPDQITTLQQSLQQKAEREKAGLQIFKNTGTPPPPPPTK